MCRVVLEGILYNKGRVPGLFFGIDLCLFALVKPAFLFVLYWHLVWFLLLFCIGLRLIFVCLLHLLFNIDFLSDLFWLAMTSTTLMTFLL